MKIMNAADGTGMVDANQDEENLKNTGKGFCITQDMNQTVESCENHAGIVYDAKLTIVMVPVMLKY